MARLLPLVFDNWTPLSFKRVLGNKKQRSEDWLARTWVGDHQRRLTAYKVLKAYDDNASRHFLELEEVPAEDAKRDNHREYGDAALMVETIKSAVLGETQTVITEGAAEYDVRTEGESDNKTAHDFQLWIRQLLKDERFPLKMIENERNTINLGDGVYVWGWSEEKGRPRLRVYDPGFYFPVLDDGNEDDFPATIHIAWELEDQDKDKCVVRRITWRRVRLSELDLPPRKYAYDPDVESDWVVLMSDGTWTIPVQGPSTVEDFSGSTVTWKLIEDPDNPDEMIPFSNIDIGVDFIPVVHTPNTPSQLNHFGQSSLSKVLQILDDISNTDTDLAAASATTGKPPVALSGVLASGKKPTYDAGEIWNLGENGSMTILDTSRSLDALLKMKDSLLERYAVNARVPQSLLGMVSPSEVPSGIALALSFGPLGSMVREMRQVRVEKYNLLYKQGWRMAVAGGMDGVPDAWVETGIKFGSYLPNDLKAAVDAVRELLSVTPPAISLETAVRMLMIAGMPIDDAAEEVSRITSRDFVGAKALSEATTDKQAAFDYLGIEPSDENIVKVLDPTKPPPVDPNKVPVPGPTGSGAGGGVPGSSTGGNT